MSFLFSKSLSEKPKEAFRLKVEPATLDTSQLVPGIDNVRFDVYLSPQIMEVCRALIFKLIGKHSQIGSLLRRAPEPLKPSDRNEFRERLQELLLNVLEHGRGLRNPQLELLAIGALWKFLISETQAQYGAMVVQAREKLKQFESPSHPQRARGYQFQEFFVNFQKNKKTILRLVSQEMQEMIEEVRNTAVRRSRESIFGEESSETQRMFSQSLICTDDGREDYLYLNHYVMLGKFQRDPDRFEIVEQQVRKFLEWADIHSDQMHDIRVRQSRCTELNRQLEALRQQREEISQARRFFPLGTRTAPPPEAGALKKKLDSLKTQLDMERETLRVLNDQYAAHLDQMTAEPDNAAVLVAHPESRRSGREQNAYKGGITKVPPTETVTGLRLEALDQLVEIFSRAGFIPYILAAYETARLYPHLCPPLNPQQLKMALVETSERRKVTHLIQEYRLPASTLDMMEDAARRVRDAGSRDVRVTLVRFLRDFFRCQHDLRNLLLAQDLMEKINLLVDPKQIELSEMNDTLFQFLLPAEEKPRGDKISSHVILKADVRESTSITAQLFSRGLNPASYFSLNFFDPVRKLLARYGASQVFLEGDAMILSIMEFEGDPGGSSSVARSCSLAREIIDGVRGVNERASKNNLPQIDLGIGISYQDSAPMYLMDEDRPIMISKAINEADHLSSCGKLAKQFLTQKSRFFNVFVMQLLPEMDSLGAAEEFRVHYNVQGVEINQSAFDKLNEELSLTQIELQLPLFGEPETVELHCGVFPVGPSKMQKIVVRRGRVPQLNPDDMKLVKYTNQFYCEVCTARPFYDYVSKQLSW